MAGAARFVLPYETVIDAAGVPIPGAKLNFYQSGTNIRLDTFSNSGLTVANANPVVADAGGRFGNIFMSARAYKAVLTDALDAEIWTADPVYGAGGSAGSIQESLRTVSGNVAVVNTDGVLEVDATLGPVTITYPLALGSVGQVQPVTIVKIDVTNNAVNIIDDSGPTLRYSLNVPANGANMQSSVVYSNGSALRIL